MLKGGENMTTQIKKGFTLIELLIVIAILGTLAVVVLLALDPVQQLARTRDSGRYSSVTQLGHAIEAYATGNNGVYPTASTTWIDTLVAAGEITVAPGAIAYNVTGTAACGATNVQNGWCYAFTAGTGAIVFARLESKANINKCAAGQAAWVVYSTAAGRGGGVCTANATTYPTAGLTTFTF